MPGAFAHLSVANVAREFKAIKSLNMADNVKAQLGSHLELIELGSVSPDYPYLTLAFTAGQDRERFLTTWANK